jgi:hypothetical protein
VGNVVADVVTVNVLAQVPVDTELGTKEKVTPSGGNGSHPKLSMTTCGSPLVKETCTWYWID